VFEQVLQRHPVGAAPFELALCLPLADSDAELDAVLDQVGKHGVQGSEFLELAEDEPNHPLDFLVRIEGHLARRPPHVAGGHGEGKLTSASLAQLAQLALMHPLLQDVQFRLAHSTF